MTPRQIELVQRSWAKVVPIQDQAARIFYTRLFDADPGLQRLFKVDMAEQGKKLMMMITVAVNGLSRLETIVPAVQDLGRRHRDYGVKDADYDTVGVALLATLRQGLGAAFTDEVAAAWAATYGLLAGTMRAAASSSDRPAAAAG
jgi:hemoglobin-like flavoprotein